MEKNFQNIKRTIYALLAIIILYILYLVFNPVYHSGFLIFIQPKKLNDLNESRNYFSSFQSIITIIASIFGLLLGYFYYNNRKKVDKYNALEGRRKFYLDKLFAEINKYDLSILTILTNIDIKLDSLRLHRVIIEQTWDIIETMIDSKTTLLAFLTSETEIFVKLNSFVDQNDVIMRSDFTDITTDDLNKIKSAYLDLVRDVRLLCLKKIA